MSSIRSLTANAMDDGQEAGDMTKRLLIIAYFFPPINNIGAIRPLKFAKYLPAFGWTPFVLTVQRCQGQPSDPHLLDDLPDEVNVTRIWHLELETIQRPLLLVWNVLWKIRLRWLANHLQPYKVTNWLLFPDNRLGWLVPAYRAAMHIIKHNQIDAVLTTSSPYTSHLVGWWLKRSCDLPWIADFRDPWTQNPYNSYPSRPHLALSRHLERQVLRNADRVLCVNTLLTQRLSELAPDVAPEKFLTVMNGYDEDDFTEVRTEVRTRNDRFLISHIGTLYGLRSARNLLAAMSSLVEDGEIPSGYVRLQLIGQNSTAETDAYRNCEWVETSDHVSHRDALGHMSTSDLLVLLISPHEKGGLTGKLFEYLASQRPILALAPEDSAAADIIRETGSGVVVPPDDITTIRSALLIFYQLYEQGRSWKMPHLDVIRQFERSRQARQLANILDSMRQ